MLLPIKWSKEYIDIDKDIMEICDKVTLTGSHVESINKLGLDIKNIVVGKILEIYKHEKSKKLWITKVDIGNEIIQIVTGAQNLIKGDYVPVAKIDAVLSDGTKIKETKLVGEPSNGMFCSYKELGYDDSVIPKEYKDGVLRIFDENIILGTDIKEILDLNDTIVEFEITPNRPDCLSIIGMSREIAATFNKTVSYPKLYDLKTINNKTNINISLLSKNCKRYSSALIKNVQIKESKRKIQNYLLNAGIRPINNIVDLTNFLLLEYGQPLHAFDYDKLDGDIIIRDAIEGEKVITLDGMERTLSKDDILICDSIKPIAIAGVMGLKNSEVDENTKNILLESAVFSKKSIKNTSKRLSIKSESSIRYEKGLTTHYTLDLIARFLYLLSENENVNIDSIFDVNNEKKEDIKIEFNINLINRLLGLSISLEEIIRYLKLLEIDTKVLNDNFILCKIPNFRTDLSIPEDIVEEVGRLYGFSNLTPKAILMPNTIGKKSKKRIFEDKVKEILFSLGLSEITTYSFIGESIISKASMNTNNVVKIINPLGEEFSIMRKSLIPNIIDVLSKNLNYKNEDLFIYELGNTFHKLDGKKVPLEAKRLVLGSYGKYEFYHLKDVVLTLLHVLNIRNVEFKRNVNISYFHKGISADIFIDQEKVGKIGQISYDVSKNFSIKKNIFVCELDIEKLYNKYIPVSIYKPIIKYPSIKRDLALVLDKNIDSGEVENIFKAKSKNLLIDIELFDVYYGDQVEDGKKSMAYKLIFQSREKTLLDDEINQIIEEILIELQNKLGAYLRS